jgi:hypothetical protein
MSPAEKEARQMVADKKMQAATDRAYEQSKRIGPRADEMPGMERLSRVIKQNQRPAPEPTVDQMGNQTGMKKGGKVSSASSRADGVASRGKTRGKMC